MQRVSFPDWLVPTLLCKSLPEINYADFHGILQTEAGPRVHDSVDARDAGMRRTQEPKDPVSAPATGKTATTKKSPTPPPASHYLTYQVDSTAPLTGTVGCSRPLGDRLVL